MSKKLRLTFLVGLAMLFTSFVMAQTTSVGQAAAPVAESDHLLEPDVRILETGEETIYEYRVNGELVVIKVQPKQGPVYYFYDRDGDGSLEFSRDNPLLGLEVNQWVLLRW